jgi:hypothetical protein
VEQLLSLYAILKLTTYKCIKIPGTTAFLLSRFYRSRGSFIARYKTSGYSEFLDYLNIVIETLPLKMATLNAGYGMKVIEENLGVRYLKSTIFLRKSGYSKIKSCILPKFMEKR